MSRSPLPTPRQEVAHAVLNGRIYVPGGLAFGGVGSAVVEVYDPATDTWSSVADLPMPLHHMGLAVVSGRLFVIGGYVGNSFAPTDSVYEFEPLSNRWLARAPLLTARGAHIAAAVGGKIYVFGGVLRGGSVTGRTDAYDPETDAWSVVSEMSVPREHLAGAVIDSLIYVVAGRSGFGNLATMEVYDPKNDTWSSRPAVPTARSGLAAAALGGKLYVLGGEIPGVYSQNEEYDPQTNSWRAVSSMLTGRHGIGAAVVGDSIYVIGGGPVEGIGVTNVNEVFTPAGVPNSLPGAVYLSPNYPNPFNAGTAIRFELPRRMFITIAVYDGLGRRVETLAHGVYDSGRFSVNWSADGMAGGVYFVRLVGETLTHTRKMTLIR